MIERLADAALVLVVCAAAWSDIRTRRIPNWLTVAGLGAALVLRILLGALPLWVGVQGAALALATAVLLFALGIIGGGDAKLLAAVGAFLGPWAFIGALAVSFVAGALLAIADAARRGLLPLLFMNLFETMLFWRRLGRSGERRSLETPGVLTVPFGLAIAVGAIIWRFKGSEIMGALFA